MEETEPVAHMIDVEPVLVLNCSASELKMCALMSVVFWFCLLLILFFISQIDIIKVILVPLLTLVFSAFTTYFGARHIGKTKRGKPHGYYIHAFEMKYISKFRKPSYLNHKGYFCLERSPKPGIEIDVSQKT